MARRLASPKLQIKSRFSVWLRRRCRNIPRLVETISLGGVFLHLSVTDTSVITGKRLFVLLTHQFGAFFFPIFSSQERGWNPERNDRQNQRAPSKTVFTVFILMADEQFGSEPEVCPSTLVPSDHIWCFHPRTSVVAPHH